VFLGPLWRMARLPSCGDGQRYYGRSPNTDPANTQAVAGRVGRGGGLGDDAAGCRSAARGYGDPDDGRIIYLGFRVVLVPVQQTGAR
jgi:formylglycine-generating enzyme required for sulfatase activity